MMVHCAMHGFRKGDQWASCCGMLTKHHDARRGFAATKAQPEHPIARTFPADWSTTGDELYQNILFPETSVPVLLANSAQSKKDHVVTMGSHHGKGAGLWHYARPRFADLPRRKLSLAPCVRIVVGLWEAWEGGKTHSGV